MQHHRRFTGFTFAEFVVVMAIIVAVAGVITPFVSRDLDDSKLNDARADVNRIASGVLRFITDTHVPPTGAHGRKAFHLLASEGLAPMNNVFDSGTTASFSSFFTTNDHGFEDWKGPYVSSTASDPWGTRYLVNVEGFFNNAERVLVISAGPNRRIDTAPDALAGGGDDVAVILQ